MTRRGTSLVEAIVFLAIGLTVLAMAAVLHARMARHDTWNASRLSAAESVLFAWERLQLDLACAGPGRVEVAADGAGVTIERAATARGERTETVTYERDARRAMVRSGRALGNVRLDHMEFRWKDPEGGLLAVHLASGGDRVEAGIANAATVLAADVHVAGRARRREFASWLAGDDLPDGQAR